MEGEAHPEAQDGVAKNSVQAGVGTRDGMSIGCWVLICTFTTSVSLQRGMIQCNSCRADKLQVFWKIGRVL